MKTDLLGLRLLGRAEIDIQAVMTYTATGLLIPRSDYFAWQVIFPPPEEGVTSDSGIVIFGNPLVADDPITLGTQAKGIPGVGFGVDDAGGLAMVSGLVGLHKLTVWEV